MIENLVGGGYQHSYCIKPGTTDLLRSPSHGNGWLPSVNVPFGNKNSITNSL
ncbi:unnamed protein product [Trichobilharzia regenti]|nr:unnamed protein product [Trichobilharzia regenti]